MLLRNSPFTHGVCVIVCMCMLAYMLEREYKEEENVSSVDADLPSPHTPVTHLGFWSFSFTDLPYLRNHKAHRIKRRSHS